MKLELTIALCVAAPNAGAQCDDWQTVPTPNPSELYNYFTDAESNTDALYALLVQDDLQDFNNPTIPHLLRRDGDAWTDLGGPGVGNLEQQPTFLAMHAADEGDVWIGGYTISDAAYQEPPAIARFSDGAWSSPQAIELVSQPIYPFHDRGGEIYAMDTAPDGTVFAVGLAKGYALTDDNSVPLFLVNSGAGWQEMTNPETDWPGGFSSDTYLTDVIAFASDNVWAVGRHAEEDEAFPVGGLIVHWNGQSLSIVDDPRVTGEFIGFPFEAMDAFGPKDIWAVGGGVFDASTAIAHFDGTEWTRVENPFDTPNPLGSILVDDDGTAWAVASPFGEGSAYFDGDEWTPQPPLAEDISIRALARGTDDAIWAFGGTIESQSLALRLECAGDCLADFNADGRLDVLDFVAFQGAFVNGADAADCDESGSLDVLDFVCFQGLFQDGCP